MSVDFSNAKTSVFWDVEDFPNPNGRSFYEIIKSALEKEGYRGDVSINAYGEKKPDGVTDFIPKRGKHARLNKMLIDIMFWALDHPKYPCVRRNLMVIAKNIPVDTKFDELLEVMATFEYNVLLVVANDCAPEEAPLPRVRTIWIWESLLDGGEPLNSTERRSLLSRVKRVPFPSEHCLFEDDGIPCPCGNC